MYKYVQLLYIVVSDVGVYLVAIFPCSNEVEPIFDIVQYCGKSTLRECPVSMLEQETKIYSLANPMDTAQPMPGCLHFSTAARRKLITNSTS